MTGTYVFDIPILPPNLRLTMRKLLGGRLTKDENLS